MEFNFSLYLPARIRSGRAKQIFIKSMLTCFDRLCGLVVRVLGYRSGGSGSIPGTTRKKNGGSGTGFTQPREYN
jgi:hypothetical protein